MYVAHDPSALGGGAKSPRARRCWEPLAGYFEVTFVELVAFLAIREFLEGVVK